MFPFTPHVAEEMTRGCCRARVSLAQLRWRCPSRSWRDDMTRRCCKGSVSLARLWWRFPSRNWRDDMTRGCCRARVSLARLKWRWKCIHYSDANDICHYCGHLGTCSHLCFSYSTLHGNIKFVWMITSVFFQLFHELNSEIPILKYKIIKLCQQW